MAVSGKVIAVSMVGFTAVFAAALYYSTVYGYYEPATDEKVELTSVVSELPEEIPVDEFQGIDATSSPIKYRACFTTPLSTPLLTETFQILDHAEPRIAPDWFPCFDAAQIGADLQNGTAIAYMGQQNIEYGIDRIVAIYDDGRGFVWHQINDCGDKLYDGSAASTDCPERDQ